MYSAKGCWVFVTSFVVVLLCVWANSESTPTDCGSSDDCSAEETPICALNLKRVCFRYFNSVCHMKISACESNREYKIYDDPYCQVDNFMCNYEFSKYFSNWAEHENMDDIILSIYRKKDRQRRSIMFEKIS